MASQYVVQMGLYPNESTTHKETLDVERDATLRFLVRMLGLPLFEDERKKLFATQAMDKVNDRYGSMSVTFGSLLPGKAKAGSHVIPLSWRPDGIKM